MARKRWNYQTPKNSRSHVGRSRLVLCGCVCVFFFGGVSGRWASQALIHGGVCHGRYSDVFFEGGPSEHMYISIYNRQVLR